MGSISENLFGAAGSYLGAQSAKSNLNKAYSRAQGALGTYNANGQNASDALYDLLLGNTGQHNAGYSKYLNSIGYQQQLSAGTSALAGSAAASGMLNSGATAKGIAAYGSNLAKQSFGNYISQLQGVVNTGEAAGAGVANAAVSTGTSAANAMDSGITNGFTMFGKSIDEAAKTVADIMTGGTFGMFGGMSSGNGSGSGASSFFNTNSGAGR